MILYSHTGPSKMEETEGRIRDIFPIFSLQGVAY